MLRVVARCARRRQFVHACRVYAEWIKILTLIRNGHADWNTQVAPIISDLSKYCNVHTMRTLCRLLVLTFDG